MTEELIEICAYKVQAHRRAYLTSKNLECKYSCSGNNKNCKDYMSIEVPKEHYLIYTKMGEIK